jgi:ethanolamine ammonia-lyase small subunit
MTGEPPDRPRQPAPGDEFWSSLRQLTTARIGLARTGASLKTAPLLDFRLAHGRARDAVLEPLDQQRLIADLAGLSDPVLAVASAAETRLDYLMRPDLGRRLAANAATVLAPHVARYDLVFVIADGLSARAVQTHAAPLLRRTIEPLRARDWRIAPLVIARHGRVALGDAVGMALHADSVAVFIGERPGLSAPDSMGTYLTWRPHAGTTDAERNCISNIRPGGIGYADAGFKIAYLLQLMRARRLSGVKLKDDANRVLDAGAETG